MLEFGMSAPAAGLVQVTNTETGASAWLRMRYLMFGKLDADIVKTHGLWSPDLEFEEQAA